MSEDAANKEEAPSAEKAAAVTASNSEELAPFNSEQIALLRSFVLSPRFQEAKQSETANEEATCRNSVVRDETDNAERNGSNQDEEEACHRSSVISSYATDVFPLMATNEASSRRKLPEDTFSFLVFSVNSRSGLLALSVFCLQLLIFCLVWADVASHASTPFELPTDVNVAVRITEFLALIVAVVTQADIRISLDILADGYSQEIFGKYFGEKPTLIKWLTSTLCRAVEGGMSLAVSFLLILQADTVLELLLNFTAIEVVSYLDDAVFVLAHRGYWGRTIRKDAEQISGTVYHITTRERRNFWRTLFLLLVFGIMVGMWGVVFHRQISGRYQCQKIYVQFGDEFVPALGTFSGIYGQHAKEGERTFSRSTYVPEEISSKGKARFGYCGPSSVWTFTFNVTGGDLNACHWRARSSESFSFDLTSTSTDEWFANNDESREVELDPFRLMCYDCNYAFCGGNNGHGYCGEDNACHCNPGWYGLRCEFPQPCESIEVDTRYGRFTGTRNWADRYNMLRFGNGTDVVVNNRPVYISEKKSHDVILFTGRRWVLTYSDITQLRSTSFNDVYGFWTAHPIGFVSEPSDVDTPTDAATPVGLQWFVATDPLSESTIQSAARRPNDAVLLCAVCNATTNPCLFNGTCHVNGTCECTTGASGTLCQVPPLGNGLCNPFFNSREFDYDGGDCCRGSCNSTAEYTCGRNESGVDIDYPDCRDPAQIVGNGLCDPLFNLRGFGFDGGDCCQGTCVSGIYTCGKDEFGKDIGYPYCADPEQLCESPSDSCWRPSSAPVLQSGELESNAFSVALSANGILVIGEPLVDNVRVLELDRNQWVQLWNYKLPGSRFGTSVVISSDGVFVAVGGPDYVNGNSTTGIVRIFRRQGNLWAFSDSVEGTREGFGATVAMSKDGSIVGAAAPDTDESNSIQVVVPGQNKEESVFVSPPNGVSAFGQSLSISGRGDVIVAHGHNSTSGADVVQAYKRNNETVIPVYVPVGSPIDGCCVVLSANALVLAVMSPSSHHLRRAAAVHAYQWNETTSDWRRRGDDVAGSPLALSLDGSFLVVGTGTTIRTYLWRNTNKLKWEQIGDEVPGGENASVALAESVDDNSFMLAVGLPSVDGNNNGKTTVYSLLNPPTRVP